MTDSRTKRRSTSRPGSWRKMAMRSKGRMRRRAGAIAANRVSRVRFPTTALLISRRARNRSASGTPSLPLASLMVSALLGANSTPRLANRPPPFACLTVVETYGALTCQDAIGLLGDYLERILGDRLLADLEAHLANCEPCGAYLKTYRKTRDLTARVGAVDMPPELQNRLRAFLRERVQSGDI